MEWFDIFNNIECLGGLVVRALGRRRGMLRFKSHWQQRLFGYQPTQVWLPWWIRSNKPRWTQIWPHCLLKFCSVLLFFWIVAPAIIINIEGPAPGIYYFQNKILKEMFSIFSIYNLMFWLEPYDHNRREIDELAFRRWRYGFDRIVASFK